ncbi:hypothetical protein [Streptomyces sp. SID11385]|uniref:hypothetical protein n=1 Tax=Streptomyces sp. SID11385 TaxID=2706031 RepID=UPI0013CC1E71|nr:hypothetical protein [Streptomyces sp. SID11385]NEA38431.1 hypothetical protein [Streptomyces sp. SID11385]
MRGAVPRTSAFVAVVALVPLWLAAPTATAASPSPAPGTGSLTLVERVVDGPGGTARAQEWTVAARGPVEIEGAHGSRAVTGARVPAGDYRLTEYGGHPGYTSTLWHCAGRTGPLPTGDGKVRVAAGDEVHCTVTNRPVAGGASGAGGAPGTEGAAGTGTGLPGPGGSRAPDAASTPPGSAASTSGGSASVSGRLADAGDGDGDGHEAEAGAGETPGAGLFLGVVSGALCAVGLGFLLVRRRLRG